MNRDDLGALLRIKRVREQRAAAELADASRQAEAAVASQSAASRALRAFGVLRKAQETAIYRRLAEDEISTGRLMAATSNLTDLAAREGSLREEVRDADRKVRERNRLAEAARAEYRSRQRRAESLDALSQRVRADARADAEIGAERSVEDQPGPARRR